MAIVLYSAQFPFGLHKMMRHPTTRRRFIDVGSVSGTGIMVGFTVVITSSTSKTVWEGMITGDQNTPDADGHPLYLMADLQVTVEDAKKKGKKKDVKGVEDITVTVKNPDPTTRPGIIHIPSVPTIP